MTKEEAMTAIQGFVAGSAVATRKAAAHPSFASVYRCQAKMMLDEAQAISDEFGLGKVFRA